MIFSRDPINGPLDFFTLIIFTLMILKSPANFAGLFYLNSNDFSYSTSHPIGAPGGMTTGLGSVIFSGSLILLMAY